MKISNFARPGYRSRHNWGYWHGADYLGVGLSAHSLMNGSRHWNVKPMRTYLAAVESGRAPCAGSETLEPQAARHERLWLQLRTCAGGRLEPAELHLLMSTPKFHAMLEAGWLQLAASQLWLTPAGFLLADAIGAEILAMLETDLQ